MPWYGSANTWKNIGKDIGSVAKTGGEGIWKTSKGVVNEVWFTGKGVITTAEGLVTNVGNTLGAFGNPLILAMLIGGAILFLVLR